MTSPYASTKDLPPGWAEASRVPEIIAGAIVPATIGTFLVLGRLFAKIYHRNWGWDDTFLVFAWMLGTTTSVLSCVLTDYGAGRHTISIRPHIFVINLKYAYATKMIYRLALTLTKISICSSYLRFFTDRVSHRLTYAMIAAIVFYSIPLECEAIWQCSPIPKSWAVSSHNACHSSIPGNVVNGVCNEVLDLTMIAFTMSRLAPLALPRRQKISLMLITNLGFLAVVASIFRTVYFCMVVNKPDFSYKQATVSTWSAVELNTGLICAAAPYMRLLWRTIRPGHGGTEVALTTKSKTHSSSHNTGPIRVRPGLYDSDSESGTVALVEKQGDVSMHLHRIEPRDGIAHSPR